MANLDDRRLLDLLSFVRQWLVVSLELWLSLLLMDKEPNQEVFHRLLHLPFGDLVQGHCHRYWFSVFLLFLLVGFLLTQFVAFFGTSCYLAL